MPPRSIEPSAYATAMKTAKPIPWDRLKYPRTSRRLTRSMIEPCSEGSDTAVELWRGLYLVSSDLGGLWRLLGTGPGPPLALFLDGMRGLLAENGSLLGPWVVAAELEFDWREG